ncbi:MAG: NAD(P)/FAD-dependent oxidoreductase [Candidatus Korarchaeota archaeon]
MEDVIIIGAGIIGLSIARELSKYELNVIVVEKGADVGAGTSKANSAIIHAGYDPEPGTLMARLNVRGNKMYEQIIQELHVPYKKCGSFVIALDQEQVKTVEELYDRGIRNGVPGLEVIYDYSRIENMEPEITTNAKAVLYAPTAGVVDPLRLLCALENCSANNGVRFRFDAEVTGLISEGNEINGVIINGKEKIHAKIVVNAAGLYSGNIAQMAGDEIKIKPRKGEYILLDKGAMDIRHILFPTPTKMGKGILVLPTAEGNILLGPTSNDVDSPEDVSISKDGIQTVIQRAGMLVKKLNLGAVITTFAGLRAVAGSDFIIAHSKKLRGLINVAGIQSPGFASAPAIAEMVVSMIKELEFVSFTPKEHFNPIVEPIPHFVDLPVEEQEALLVKNPAYGKIICRCEMVSEGEVIDAIRRGARTLDGIKFRVRCGAGRCQGGFCTPYVLQILSRELKIPLSKIRKNDDDSWIVLDKWTNEKEGAK